MKLYYYVDPNFGDALNPFLWNQLLPDAFNDDARTLFVGTGTLLNNGIPRSARKLVFGSGAGYGSALPVLDNLWNIYWVRGPLTARALGLGEHGFISDGALLLRTLALPPALPSNQIAFMPHCRSTAFWDWKNVSEAAGLKYIDPFAPVPEVIAQIRQSAVLITEALHGAIVADAFRVPWVPVRAYRTVLESKWQDWCGSLGLTYEPVALPPLYSRENIVAKFSGKRGGAMAQIAALPARVASPFLVAQVKAKLRALHDTPPSRLSEEQILERSIERMMAQLTLFRREYMPA